MGAAELVVTMVVVVGMPQGDFLAWEGWGEVYRWLAVLAWKRGEKSKVQFELELKLARAGRRGTCWDSL